MKSQKIDGSWGLGLKTTFGPLGPTRHPAASAEPWLQFSQTRPHFLKNHEKNPLKFIDFGAWGLGTTFG